MQLLSSYQNKFLLTRLKKKPKTQNKTKKKTKQNRKIVYFVV